MKTYISKSELDTINFAREFAKSLTQTSIVVLSGELGCGKTKFTEGILDYFGLADEISSPTFTIVNEYRNKDIAIFHFDVYRLSHTDDFFDIGGDDYFDKGICIIEWGELIKSCLPEGTIFVNFEKDLSNKNIRKITIS